MGDEQTVWREHLDAVQADDASAFLRLVARDGVFLGKVNGRLSAEEQRTKRSILQYCARWENERGPHPDTLPKKPIGRDLWELNQWRKDKSGHAELLDWSHASTQDLRGRWAAVLERLSKSIAQAQEPAAGEPTPSHGAHGERQKPAVDVAIAGFRTAYREWDAAIPHVGVSISALDGNGNGFTMEYRLPSGDPMLAPTAEERARFGFAMVPWSSLPQPVLAPADEAWRAAYDKCSAARNTLAKAADVLAAAVDGTDDSARCLRGGAERLAIMLRNVPPVWPTKEQTDLAFEVNNGRIVEFRQALNEARRRREAAEAVATEERRKQKAELANDALIAWHAEQKNPPAPDKASLPRGDKKPPRPRPEAIDATAKACLVTAMTAAQEAGTEFAPSRAAIANTVSNALGHTITVAALFGTKNLRGERVPRYPAFHDWWRKCQLASRSARRDRTGT